MAYEFKLPDIGEGIHEGEIVQWLVQPGDFVKEDQAIVEVMTDKVTAEIPSPVSGTITELRGKAGEVVRVGSVIAVFDKQGAPSKPREEKQAVAAGALGKATKSEAAQPQEAPPKNGNGKSLGTAVQERPSGNEKVLAAPATRKLARELGVDLSQLAGSGPRGRVTQSDVRSSQSSEGISVYSKPMAVTPEGYHSRGEKRVAFTGMRRKIAEHLVHSKHTAPHFAYVEEADMTRLVAMRNDLAPLAEEQGVKLSYLPFIIKAVIAGLRKYPALNAQLDDAKQELVYKNDFHIGVAVATNQGLIVPVVKFADQKSLFTLATDIKTLAEKARSNKLSLDELKGGTFTITSIGSIGGLFSVPIINHPEVAILGVNKIEKRPVVRQIDRQDQIVIREMMHVSIAGDHRVVDGAETALFVKEVIRYMENPALLLAAEGL